MNSRAVWRSPVWQVNRRVRDQDKYVGKMVGFGQHFSYDGVVEPFKPVKLGERERKRGTLDDQASVMHHALKAFERFEGEWKLHMYWLAHAHVQIEEARGEEKKNCLRFHLTLKAVCDVWHATFDVALPSHAMQRRGGCELR